MPITRTVLFRTFLLFLLAVPFRGHAQDLHWNGPEQYDTGIQPSVAIHPTGLVVEFHKSQNTDRIWYRIGRAHSYYIDWGRSREAGSAGFWPAVVITKEGYVILTYSSGSAKRSSDLKYSIGQVKLTGEIDQAIQWKSTNVKYDRGFHNSIAYVNETVVDVHESGEGGKGMFYRIGWLLRPENGTISWLTDGTHYDEGVNPHIAVDANQQVVEVHQGAASVPNLFYRRGILTALFRGGASIDFQREYLDGQGVSPSVAMTGNGSVLEFYSSSNAYYRTGRFAAGTRDLIHWTSSSVLTSDHELADSQVATNGKVAVAVFAKGKTIWYTISNPY
jgi:hypothetical protein